MADLVCQADVRSHGEDRNRRTVKVSIHCSGTGLPERKCWAKELGLLNKPSDVAFQGKDTPGFNERTARRFVERECQQLCEDYNVNGRTVESL